MLRGYASVFNQWTKILPRLEESVSRGAFLESIQKDDIRALWNHNSDYPIGRNRNGTLKLEEDELGLRFELEPNDTSWGRDAYEAIKRGDVSGMSFGFYVMSDEWVKGEGETPTRRTIKKAKLLEISPTVFPAYEGASVSSRSLETLLADKEGEWTREVSREIDKRNRQILAATREIALDSI